MRVLLTAIERFSHELRISIKPLALRRQVLGHENRIRHVFQLSSVEE